jgi:hypothetical protein
VTVRNEEKHVRAFVIEYPPQPTVGPPGGIDLLLPMSGEGVGCFRFEALFTNQNAETKAEAVFKDLYQASIDLLALTDASRTYMNFTNMSFRLSKNAQVYSIQPI